MTVYIIDNVRIRSSCILPFGIDNIAYTFLVEIEEFCPIKLSFVEWFMAFSFAHKFWKFLKTEQLIMIMM